MNEDSGFGVQGPASGGGNPSPGSAIRNPRAKVGLRAMVLAVLACAVVAMTVKYTRYYVVPKRFAVVEPGRLYRSGYCQPGPLKRMIREHRIRTILNLLADEPDSKEQQREEAVARAEGVKTIRIWMPGDGCADFGLLDQAAAVIADSSHYPLLVHCYAGVNRTGAAYAVWRMKYCGWTVTEALREAESHGMSPDDNPEVFTHLKRYAARMNASAARTSAPAGN